MTSNPHYLFFFNDPATTEIYTRVHTLSLHDALPIRPGRTMRSRVCSCPSTTTRPRSEEHTSELQSRTLSSYAVFCLKKKKKMWESIEDVFYVKYKNKEKKRKIN